MFVQEVGFVALTFPQHLHARTVHHRCKTSVLPRYVVISTGERELQILCRHRPVGTADAQERRSHRRCAALSRSVRVDCLVGPAPTEAGPYGRQQNNLFANGHVLLR